MPTRVFRVPVNNTQSCPFHYGREPEPSACNLFFILQKDDSCVGVTSVKCPLREFDTIEVATKWRDSENNQ